MKTLLIIPVLIVIVSVGNSETSSGYFYPPPSEIQSPQDNSPTENIDINRFVYFFKPPPTEKKPPKKPIINIPPPKKNYKIIFIQAPEPPAPVEPVLPALPQNEEKTIVYVLNKKPEEQPKVFLPTPKPTKPSSPEVYFINYDLQKNNSAPEEVSEQPEVSTSNIPSSTQTPSSSTFKVPSQYLPPAPQYGLQGTLDIPPDVLSVSSVPNEYLPPKTSYGVPFEAEASTKLPPNDSEIIKYLPPKTNYGEPLKEVLSTTLPSKYSYGTPIEDSESYQSQVRNSRSALKKGSTNFMPYLYFQRESAVN